MRGNYVTGIGKAHKCCEQHEVVFHCRMYGTFNIHVHNENILEHSWVKTSERNKYWLIKMSKNGGVYYGWAVRGHESRQGRNVLEMVTKRLLPDSFKQGSIAVEFCQPWSPDEVKEWARDKYWFQSFDWGPKRADSKLIWNCINTIDWSNLSVLDIGCHYGYHSFQASKLGAFVTGVETNKKSLSMARTIQENIEMNDVHFVGVDPGGKFDAIMYLSVHHQVDEQYVHLKDTLKKLRERANKFLFIELIMPPLFPKGRKMSEADIDSIVGGTALCRYHHKVRGVRKIYMVKL